MKKKDEIEENGNEGNNEDEKDNESKVKWSRYTPWRHMGGRGGIAPTHS
jgi:hypothetical protein